MRLDPLLFASRYASPTVVWMSLSHGERGQPVIVTCLELCPWLHDTHTATCPCRTALQAYVIDVIHSLVEEQISPVLVRLATTGPQVRARPFCERVSASATIIEMTMSLQHSTTTPLHTKLCVYNLSPAKRQRCERPLLAGHMQQILQQALGSQQEQLPSLL